MHCRKLFLIHCQKSQLICILRVSHAWQLVRCEFVSLGQIPTIGHGRPSVHPIHDLHPVGLITMLELQWSKRWSNETTIELRYIDIHII